MITKLRNEPLCGAKPDKNRMLLCRFSGDDQIYRCVIVDIDKPSPGCVEVSTYLLLYLEVFTGRHYGGRPARKFSGPARQNFFHEILDKT